MSNGCNGDCFSNYNKNDDDFVVQRLQDIITICEFLIKHEKNSNSKKSLKEIIDEIDENEKKDESIDDGYKFYINTYKKPIWVKPYYHYPGWDFWNF